MPNEMLNHFTRVRIQKPGLIVIAAGKNPVSICQEDHGVNKAEMVTLLRTPHLLPSFDIEYRCRESLLREDSAPIRRKRHRDRPGVLSIEMNQFLASVNIP
jgi:hypothetical protein